MFTTQQIRTAYLTACFNAQREISSVEFMNLLAADNIFISAMTASLVSGSYDSLQIEAEVSQEELVAA